MTEKLYAETLPRTDVWSGEEVFLDSVKDTFGDEANWVNANCVRVERPLAAVKTQLVDSSETNPVINTAIFSDDFELKFV